MHAQDVLFPPSRRGTARPGLTASDPNSDIEEEEEEEEGAFDAQLAASSESETAVEAIRTPIT